MPEQKHYNPTTGQWESSYSAELTGGDIASHAATAASGTTAGKGLGALAKDADQAPKQNPGEDVSEYSERLRKWRSSRPSGSASAQASALRSPSPKPASPSPSPR